MVIKVELLILYNMLRKIIQRNIKTTEIIISKIFPAGCGWQYGSIVATHNYYIPSDISFMLTCGIYQGMAVGVGHWLYMMTKKNTTDYIHHTIRPENPIDMTLETYKAIQFGTASVVTGTVWQPTVDLLRYDGFYTTAIGTGITCGAFFFTGLTLSKYICRPKTNQIINRGTIAKDALLSISIGGANAMSVATDPIIHGNILTPIYGIGDMLAYNSIYIAGFSTASGFMVIQFIQNFKPNWID